MHSIAFSDMSLEILNEQLKTGNFSRLYYFDGDCLYLKRFYLDSLVKKIIPAEALSTDVYRFVGKDMTVDDFVEATGNFALQSSNKVIIIKDMPMSSEVISYLMKEPDVISDSVTVAFINEFTSPDARLKNTKEFEKFISQNGLLVKIDQLSDDILRKWVIQTLKKEDKRISPADADYLINNVGKDMYNLKNEIMKLATINFNETVSREDIDSICIFVPDAVVFNLSNDILDRNADSALKRVFDLMSVGNDANYLLGVISKAVTQLVEMKLLLLQGLSAYDIAKTLEVKDFIVNKNMPRLKNTSLDLLKKMLEACLSADIELKNFGTDQKTVLTKLVVGCTSK